MQWRELFLPAGSSIDGPPFPERVWRMALVALHIAFVLLVALAAADIALSSSHGQRRLVGLIALGVLAVAYLSLGRAALGQEAAARAVGYLVVMTACVGAVAWSNPGALFLLFIVYPQVWFLVEQARPGAVWTALIFSSSTAGVVVAVVQMHHRVFGAISSQLLGVAFSLVIGIWTAQVLEHNRRQSVLIADLERAQSELATAHHERGVLAERERVARDVHDTLAQGYTSIVMLAQTAAASADRSVTQERLALIEEVARDNLQEARTLVGALSPVEIDGTTLREALTHLVDRFARETGTGVTLHLDADTTGLTRADEVVLLRAAQEALSNARRHAAATAVSLRLERAGHEIAVRVTDDGIGFVPPTPSGSGLAGLRRRLEQAGGSLEVESELGSGTQVIARMVPGS